jgi:hypothetical protein
MPDLHFQITDAETLPFAAVPTILFKVAITNESEGEQIHSVMLRTQLRIETTRRQYGREAEQRLLELFGEPHRWGETLRSLLWTNATTVVPRFDRDTVAELPITCTYDFDVASVKYFDALDDGEIPLLFLFSGTVFYAPDGGSLQIGQISWEREASYRLPIRVWREMMDHYFPNSSWLRVRKDIFDWLYRYKSQRALPTWEATLSELLAGAEARLER